MTENATDYLLRPPTQDDATAIVAMMRAYQTSIGDTPDMSVEELRRDWFGVNLEEDALLVMTLDGEIVGYADIFNRRFIQVNVYVITPPGPRHAQTFDDLMKWGEEWVNKQRPADAQKLSTEIHYFLRDTDSASITALKLAGYSYARTHYVMVVEMNAPPPDAEWPAGLAVRTYRPGVDDDDVFVGGEEPFQDMWNRPPSTKEHWLQPTQAEDFDPTLWFLPFDQRSGEVAGNCRCSILNGSGNVDTLGVRRPWRRQGLGMALLQHAFGEFWRRGIRTVRLSVDASSPTGAPRLYERAGFQVEKQYTRYVKRV